MNERLASLHEAGVSIWLDDLSRDRITSGNLAQLIAEYSVTGVTTNPTIFAAAFQDMSVYGAELAALKARGADVPTTIRELMAADVASACDLFTGIYGATEGFDGRVSIEVDPTLANKTEATIEQAGLLKALVGRPNVLVKIPATKEGLPAIRAAIGAGISVNVTLIFSLERYREVMEAYLCGLDDALDAGITIADIHSVASFFVSRVDTEVDKRLDAIGTEQALALKGKAAVANARLAFDEYLKVFESDRFLDLHAKGANVQRPLWASTGTKDPSYPDTLYVASLVTRPVVNTMPEKTLQAFADHGEVDGDTVRGWIVPALETMADLAAVGIDYDDVVDVLEAEGVQKFIDSWSDLVAAVQSALEAA
ncbi:MAG: transaldolase [Propionibacteriaceae bacterium]|jgi:transaldolase|nr:transaldolase [Propionibacteriaceae bacterium]